MGSVGQRAVTTADLLNLLVVGNRVDLLSRYVATKNYGDIVRFGFRMQN